jgi:hypothetical protein
VPAVERGGGREMLIFLDSFSFARITLVWNILIAASPVEIPFMGTGITASARVRAKTKNH